MIDTAQQLKLLRQRIAARNASDEYIGDLQYVAITQTSNVFNLDFYGRCCDESYEDFLDTIARSDVAPLLRSIVIRGPDEGANGTRNWDIEPLLATGVTFTNLEKFSIQLNQPGDHNRIIIGSIDEEDGVLARLIEKTPRIQELTVPSAPSAAFFNIGKRPIRFLSVDSGYDTQDFIANLAKSSCFPDLQRLEWGEYQETYLEDYLDNCTQAADYQKLFKSNAFASVGFFLWRNPVCTSEDIRSLKALKPNLQFLVVHYSDYFV